MTASVSITSFGTFRRRGGVVLSNLGVVGAQLTHFGRTDDAVVRAELAAYRPDLIVLAFGTNEGFSPSSSGGEAYEAALRDQIARMRRLAGANVPILLLGPPDAGDAAARASAIRPGPAATAGSSRARSAAVRERQMSVARADAGRPSGTGRRRWAGAAPPTQWRLTELMRGDHVHFTRSGGDRIGAHDRRRRRRAAASRRAARRTASDRRRP